MTQFLDDGPSHASVRLVLAHGAGAPMTSPFMSAIAGLIGRQGVAVTRFEFAYMAARRDGGSRKPPPKAERLQDEFKAAVAAVVQRGPAGQHLLIGGKSLGGRVASLVAQELYDDGAIAGLVSLGYPFHAPAKPDVWRIAQLASLSCPALIVQGERDPFGRRGEVEARRRDFSPGVGFAWMPDGDHDLRPRVKSGVRHEDNLAAAAAAVADFAAAHAVADD